MLHQPSFWFRADLDIVCGNNSGFPIGFDCDVPVEIDLKVDYSLTGMRTGIPDGSMYVELRQLHLTGTLWLFVDTDAENKWL